MESRSQLIATGLSFLGRSELRRDVYRKVNGHNTAGKITSEVKSKYPRISVNLVLNELKKLDKHLIRVKKKVGKNKIYEKIPEFAGLGLENRKTVPGYPQVRRVENGKKTAGIVMKRLLKFRGEYPQTVFYDRLEDEINLAYSISRLPNAVLLLSRKLIENLVYNLLEYKFGPQGINIYYYVSQRRAHDFSVLLHNLEENKNKFQPNEIDLIEQFLKTVHPFRRDANSKAHKVMDYLDKMSSIGKFKIPEMVTILLDLIAKVQAGQKV
jgi:hypothetical protein